MVLVNFIGGETLATDIRPIYTAAAEIGGPIAGYIAGIVGVMTLLSMANSGLLASHDFRLQWHVMALYLQFLPR